MGTRLENLIENIDPSQLYDRVSQAVDAAFNSFRYDYPIKSFDDYQKCMSQFVQHIEQVILGFRSRQDYDRTFFWTRYSNLVNAQHGRDAWKMNYEKILTGKEGGLYQLLKDVAGMILKDRPGHKFPNGAGPYGNRLQIARR